MRRRRNFKIKKIWTINWAHNLNEQEVYVMNKLQLAEEMHSFSSLILAWTHSLFPLLALERYHGRKPWYKYCGVQPRIKDIELRSDFH